MQSFTSIDYTPDLDIRNIENLPRGGGCRYLLCISGLTEEVLIAESWHRKKPVYKSGQAVVMFGETLKKIS